jgi:large subunit ribosomal protein L23
MDSHQVIQRPLHTEKSVDDIRGQNTYHFRVHPKATKSQIRHAVEELFPSVKVAAVRTLWVPGKPRRMRFRKSTTSSWKKAIVKLRPGPGIELGY